jgi:outer membrane receptor protein involved in Fe transport
MIICLVLVAWLAQTVPGAGEVRGRVTDQDGLAVPGATVFIISSRAADTAHKTITGNQGRFTFVGLAPGAYSVRAELDGFNPADHRVQVTAGGTAEVMLQLVVRPYGETVIVTGSRKEEMVRYAPAAISVQSAADIQAKPVANFADVLRSVPGVNVIQFSARDVQFVARGAASQASNKTLALVDGRPAYQPYYGMIVWDLLGVDFDEIKQVEVMRGPGSALWGTNALTGVVNIITRDPGEDLGTHVRLGGGSLDTADVALRHSGVRGRIGYKFSGSFFTQRAWDRPSTLPDGTPLPAYPNQGTERVSGSARLDFKPDDLTRGMPPRAAASSRRLVLRMHARCVRVSGACNSNRARPAAACRSTRTMHARPACSQTMWRHSHISRGRWKWNTGSSGRGT